jgi:hypothetical protein
VGKNFKTFIPLFILAVIYSAWKFSKLPLSLAVMMTPTLALWQLIWLGDLIQGLPSGHWALKIPGVPQLGQLVAQALALPNWFRIVVVPLIIVLSIKIGTLF